MPFKPILTQQMPDYRVSRAAQTDIVEIGRYTQREWGIPQRRKYLDGMDQHMQMLANHPLLGTEHTEFDPPVRIHPYDRHLIVYVQEQDGILIVRILHASMDVTSRL